jgi:poly(hydroxyalkanoate) depolymerase family esterase
MRRGLGSTIQVLTRGAKKRAGPDWTLLQEVTAFGSNPGSLTMLAYVPRTCRPGAPLVVVLHGCTQTAEGYARGAGWLEAADRYGFALLCPEQTPRNNPNVCFNWFVSEDIQRGHGEAASIAQMIAHMTETQPVDAHSVYITWLSAGGAMANVMLATYPELFSAGAIIAGLPYASAENVHEAFAAMAHRRDASDVVLGQRIRAAAGDYAGPWPKVSVWHGTHDATVSPAAGDAVARQWVNVHDAIPARSSAAGHRAWEDADGVVVVEHRAVAGMAHGAPLDTHASDAVGVAGAYLLDVGISSTLEILKAWGVAPREPSAPRQSKPSQSKVKQGKRDDQRTQHLKEPMPTASSAGGPIDIGAVINNALRAAGLLK